MRFFIVLALLCCCYAAEQSTPATQQEGRLPPQHIKDFVEQHIKYIKQQIPSIQQQVKEGKLKVEIQHPKINDQQVPENIKEFIKAHITQVLQYVSQQKQNKRPNITLDTSTTSGVPPFVVQEIEKLNEDVKNIIKQTETHIPQVINQQTAHNNHLNEKQESSAELGKETVNVPLTDKKVVGHHVKTRAVNDNIQKIPDNQKEVVSQMVQHVPQRIHQHVDEKDVENKPVVLLLVEEIVKQTNGHVQVENAQIQKREVQDKPMVIADHVQGIVKPIHQQIPQAGNQHVDNTKNPQIKPIAPEHIEGVVEQIHKHIPQVINQHVAQNQKKDVQEAAAVPGHVQGVVLQIHQHVPQIVSQHVTPGQKEDTPTAPVVSDNVQGIVQQIHQHVPQVMKQQAVEVQKNGVQGSPVVPAKVENTVQQIHQHIPQVLSQHVGLTQKKDVTEKPVVLSNIESIVQNLHHL